MYERISPYITRMMRRAGQNFVMPLFNGDIDPGITYKESDDKSLGASPVGLADVGCQIIFGRDITKKLPYFSGCFTGS